MAHLHPIRAFCTDKAITQRAFADTVGMTEGFISQLITGRERCGRNAALAIQTATGGVITVSDLFEYEDKHHVPKSGARSASN